MASLPQDPSSSELPRGTYQKVDDLAEEFARRWRDGERPSIEEYAARFPHWATAIRELFPTVVMMEELKPRNENLPPQLPPSQPFSGPPERLGEYRILAEIGRGGMGVVYEGRHETLDQRVAIKVLPANLFTTEKLRSRFRREAQAAARLHHTNIIPVFGVGEQDGLCFYVMQLIKGISLDKKIHNLNLEIRNPKSEDNEPRMKHGLNTDSNSGCIRVSSAAAKTDFGCGISDFNSVAKIGVQVADALAYAHGQGILHRDIKPSNLILDGTGVVWVADFGVAKMVDEVGEASLRPNLTLSGEMVGTLKYMPPERLFGQSDARGDVYSLGITLYEMLTGRSPFPDTTPQHLIQMIQHGLDDSPKGPPTLRSLNATIPVDLETIVLKSAAHDPGHRYQTAAELADDLRRFLDDRPILARRASLAQQFWRWCRKNRAVASLSAAAIGLLVITTVVSALAYLRTAAANKETTRALGDEKIQRRHAEKTSAAALEALNRIYNRFAPARIIVTPELPTDNSNSGQADGNEGGDQTLHLPPQPILSPEAVPLLEELLGFYEQLALESHDYPNLQAQAAEANQRIGDIRQRLGHFEQAIAAYRKAIDMYFLLPEQSETGRIKLARTFNELSRAFTALQKIKEAQEAQDQALTMLTETNKEIANRPEHRYELARTYYLIARRHMPMVSPGPGFGGSGGRGGFGPRGPRGPDGFGPGGPGQGGRVASGDSPGRGGFGEPGPGGPGRNPGRRSPGDFNGRRGPGGRGPGGPPGRGPGDFDVPPPPDSADSSASLQAIYLLRDLVKEHPSVPEYKHLLACCYRDAPPNRGQRGPVAELPRVPTKAEVWRLPLQGPGGDSPNTNVDRAIDLLRQLVKDFPKVPDYRYDLAETLARQVGPGGRGGPGGPGPSNYSNSFSDSKNRLEEALKITSALSTEYPTMPQYAASKAQVHDKLGLMFERMQELDKAEQVRRKAVALQSDLVKKHPDVIAYDYSLSVMESSLARLLRERENWKDARPLLEDSTSRLEALWENGERRTDPMGRNFMRMTLNRTYRDLSEVLSHLGEKELASAAIKKAETYGPDRRP